MLRVGVTDRIRNILNGHIAVPEQCFGPLHADLRDLLSESLARLLADELGDVGRREMELFGQILQRDCLVVGLDEIEHRDQSVVLLDRAVLQLRELVDPAGAC